MPATVPARSDSSTPWPIFLTTRQEEGRCTFSRFHNWWIFAVPLALTFTQGCQREKRELLIPADRRSVPSTDYRESELIPGAMASLVSSGSGRQSRAYSDNSNAISEGQDLYSRY